MYNNYILFLVILFVSTILASFAYEYAEHESFRRRWRRPKIKKIGKSIKKFATSPAGMATFGILGGVACGVATLGVAAPVCAGLIAGALNDAKIRDINKRRKKKYKRDLKNEAKRRCRVLTGRENPFHNGMNPFSGKESVFLPCQQFKERQCENNMSTNPECKTLQDQCRLSRSCIYYDSHLMDKGKYQKVEKARN